MNDSQLDTTTAETVRRNVSMYNYLSSLAIKLKAVTLELDTTPIANFHLAK
jgi:hypothetical protein